MAVKIIKEDRDTWTKETRALARVCESTGYKLVDALWDDGLLIVKIAPISEYASDIGIVERRGKIIEIKASTVSFGYLNSTDYDKYADQARKTYTLLKYLDEFDFDKLEHINSK